MRTSPTALLVLVPLAFAARADAAQSASTPPASQAPAPGAQAPAAKGATAPSSRASQGATFPAEQLEQIVAPIALYPDSLVAQILMGSTYPLEIVEAARWLKQNPKLSGDKLEAKLKEQTWDSSVKALCAVPDVVTKMNDNLDWTQDLGDAFLGQKEELMKTIQAMRRKALDAGQLKSSKEMKVVEQPDKIIVIESPDPEVVYVPTYYPSATYGSWSYPYWYYPPMYPPPPAGGFWFGFSVGVIWGGAWGGCGWGDTDIDIDVDHHHDFADRTERADRSQRVKDKTSASQRGGKGTWQHDPSHRKGVNYKDSKVAQQYGGSAGQKRVSKDQARGYGDRASTRAGGASQRPAGGASAGTGAVSRPGGGTTPSQRPASTGSASTRSSSTARTGQSSGSFTGSRGTSMDRASSTRGSSSRGSSGARGGGMRGGGGRGGGRR